MYSIGQLGHDPEIVSSALKCPEEIRVRGVRCRDSCTVGEDHSCADELIREQSVLALEQAVASA